MKIYIYQQSDWPNFRWDSKSLILPLSTVRHLQGKLVGKMEALGFKLRNEAALETLTTEVIKTSEIEGQILNLDQVRSSIARRLGIEVSGLIPSDRNVDGIVEMMINATQNYKEVMTPDRLFGWHSALFPSGRSGMYKIIVGRWRDDSTGPMQVVSGALGKEKVHYQAPPAEDIKKEMKTFLSWFNKRSEEDLILKSAIAHLWFITIHPFEDGNGRIARALSEMLLTRSDNAPQRFYSMSAQIRSERKDYYKILEKIQKGTLDITEWLVWYLKCIENALNSSDIILSKVLYKHKFWTKFASENLNNRQILLINKLLDNFTGQLTTSKWAKIAKCSQDTALRDIQALVNKKILQKNPSGGRSTSYTLITLKEKQPSS
ncbi:MAG: cell filamentation protein Fic [Bacteroidetes bacterium RBG_13_43_22]|nr:MAG: cell filamentation protein Fic [Bacteroidetes bacterium RBG_13_43_22]